jgi:cytoskeletal protein RodZ
MTNVMKPDKESLSFGQYLQAIRLEKKISLEQVSEETRIGLGMLKLIEKEDYDNLPDEVYVKGFLRSIARAIGADDQAAVQRYESRLNVAQKLSGSEADSGKLTLNLWWKLLYVLAVYFALIAGSVLGISYLSGDPSGSEAFGKHVPGQRQPVTRRQAQNEMESDETTTQAVDESLILDISAREDTWMKVIVDSGDPKEYDLKTGDHVELEASSNFNLLIGNATGVKLALNGKAIRVTGKSGEMVNLNLP